MGLSGRKEKQRIPADPRNLTWADDAAKFGSNYLSKFGWDASRGLGVGGDGRTSHIKVSQKLDMLGIGAAHQKDPSGIAWKQNKDFENLLKRLNDSNSVGVTENQEDTGDIQVEVEGVKKRKRKQGKGKEEEERVTKSKRKKGSLEEGDASGEPKDVATTNDDIPSIPAAKPFIPRHRAHRARVIASKSIASKSAAAISEILGVAPTPTTSAVQSGSATPQGKLTSLDDDVTLEKLTTSTKSVADYFRDKLLARSSKSNSTTPTTVSLDKEDSCAPTRRGIGIPKLQDDEAEGISDTETQRMGISKFSSLMTSSFLAATTLMSAPIEKSILPLGPSETGGDPNPLLDKKAKKKKEKKVKREMRDRNSRDAEDTVEQDDKTKSKEDRKRARAERRALKESKRESSDL